MILPENGKGRSSQACRRLSESVKPLSAPSALLGFLIKEIKQHLLYWMGVFRGNLMGFAISWWMSCFSRVQTYHFISCPVKTLQERDLFLPDLQVWVLWSLCLENVLVSPDVLPHLFPSFVALQCWRTFWFLSYSNHTLLLMLDKIFQNLQSQPCTSQPSICVHASSFSNDRAAHTSRCSALMRTPWKSTVSAMHNA